MKKILKFILDILFPIRCLGCGQEKKWLCPNCLKQISLKERALIKYTHQPLNGLIISGHYHDPLLKKAIINFKYSFIKDLSLPLSSLMIKQMKLIKHRHLLNSQTILIPVPLHKIRLRWRGFNQSERLAQIISQELNIPLVNNLLIRTRHNSPQVKITSATARQANIKNAFALNTKNPVSLKNKIVILIDDVATTSATLQECAAVLKQLSPKEIWGVVLARG